MGKICPLRIGHVIRRMRNGYRRIVNGVLWEMSELKSFFPIVDMCLSCEDIA